MKTRRQPPPYLCLSSVASPAGAPRASSGAPHAPSLTVRRQRVSCPSSNSQQRRHSYLRYILCLISLLAGIFALSAAPAYAQDGGTLTPTLTPDTGEIYGIRFLNALPAAVRFRVRINVPHEQVTRVTLNFWQADGVNRTVEIDRETSIFINFGDQVEYEYNWDIVQEPGLLVFQPLTYHFEVETADGVLSEAEEEVFIVHQDVGEWQSIQEDFVTLYWYSERIAVANQLENMQDFLALLKAQTGFATPVTFVLYDPDTTICEQTTDEQTGELKSVLISDSREFPCSLDALRDLYDSNGMILLIPPNTEFQTVASLLIEKIVNIVYTARWQGADVPAWFAAGLAQLYNRQGRPGALGTVQRASQEDRLLRLNQMSSRPALEWQAVQVELWQAQAFLLTLYLAETFGASTPFDIATAIDGTGSFTEVLTDMTGATEDRLYRGWRVWIDSPRAAQAVRWNPYQPTTPTPSPTVTFSPVPPTRTLRPSPTITHTPTNVPFYIPPVELVTQTATIRPTVSNTPLPPGFFNTPTPSPSGAKSDGKRGICGTGIGAILLPAIGFVLTRRKHK